MGTSRRPLILAYANETIIRPRMGVPQFLLCGVGSVMLAATAYLATRTSAGWELLMIGAFGLLMFTLGVLHMLPGESYIRMGESGFWWRELWMTSDLYRWDRIVGFEIVRGRKGATHIEMSLRTGGKSADHLRKAHRRRAFLQEQNKVTDKIFLSGYGFGMTDEELIELLEAHRQRALGTVPQQP